MATIKEMLASAAKVDAKVPPRGNAKVKRQEPVIPVPAGAIKANTVSAAPADTEESGEDDAAELFSVYKVADGERGKRASKANVTREEAEAYVAERPDDTFEIVADEG